MKNKLAPAKEKPSKKLKINYIRKQVPHLDIPSYKGNHYDDMVPDTLDIQERIKLAVNGLTGPTDPEKDYLLYFSANFRSNPPSMSHGKGDICQVKFMEALPLMRLASGSNLNYHIDPVWMAFALRQIGPDGLFYWPSFPWAKYPDADECRPCPPGKHYALPWSCGRVIGVMTAYHLCDPSGPWDKEIKKIVSGLWSIAIDKGDYAYFPQGAFLPNRSRVKKSAIPIGRWSSFAGWVIQGLAQYHRISDYEPAIDLAKKLSHYSVYHGRYYGPNGEFLPDYAGKGDKTSEKRNEQGFEPGPPPANNLIHFQSHMIPLLGMLDHAIAVGDKDLCEFVRKSFQWAKIKGNTMVGYFPENIDNVNQLETSEICEVAGMIGLALKLSAAGLGDYWDDADRWIRNQFAEGQLLQTEWIYHMTAGALITGKTRIPLSTIDPVSETCDGVPERIIGVFAGWPTANDWFVGHGSGIMPCCTGNGARTLYYIWEHMISYNRGTLSVNLLLNRPSEWADIKSYIPYEGQVDVFVKKPCNLRVRIPEWVNAHEVRCSVNDRRHKINRDGRYALIGEVKSDDKISVKFPIKERIIEVDIEKQHYILVLKGNEVVNINPPGRFCPFYQRNHYRQDVVRWKKVSRFVSKELIYW